MSLTFTVFQIAVHMLVPEKFVEVPLPLVTAVYLDIARVSVSAIMISDQRPGLYSADPNSRLRTH